jgi:putative ABC transport system permease protein
VGVVADAKNEAIRSEGRMNVYLPYSENYTPSSLIVRASGDPLRLAQAVRQRIAGVDPNIVVSRVLSLEQIVDRSAWEDRFFTTLFAVFAALATALAAAGLYAVLAYTVSLRTHEIGIRMALGARASQVRAMVIRQGLQLAGAGLLLGVAAAMALTRLLEAQLYQTSPTDLGTYVSVIAVMLLVSLAAVFMPSRRATRVNPVIALRQE